MFHKIKLDFLLKKSTLKYDFKKKPTLFKGQSMQLSQIGIRYLKRYESLSLVPYDDQTGLEIHEWNKNATIGYGWLIKEKDWDKFKDGITETLAIEMLYQQVYSKVINVNNVVMLVLNQNQFDACVIFAYNIGNHGFRSSSALKLINNPNAKTNYSSLESAWKAWKKSKGKVMQGLINRRNNEWSIYKDGYNQ